MDITTELKFMNIHSIITLNCYKKYYNYCQQSKLIFSQDRKKIQYSINKINELIKAYYEH